MGAIFFLEGGIKECKSVIVILTVFAEKRLLVWVGKIIIQCKSGMSECQL